MQYHNHIVHNGICFYSKNQGYVKENKFPARKKIAFELLHQRLGHRSTRSLLAGDTANGWENVELRIDPDLFAPHVKYLQRKKC